MKLPFSWLKEYVDVPLSPERLAEALTLSGTKVERVEGRGESAVIHVEVTTNRPDCLSMIGLSREVAAFTGGKTKFQKINAAGSSGKPVRVDMEDKKACPHYTARLIREVVVKPAPPMIQKCLAAVGTRAINNVVDATNFVLFEMGQPLHAFDYDKLAGGTLVVRRATKKEKFLAIDGGTYDLDEETLVIADAERPVAIAGVMGGKLTEVTNATRNVLLESAYFDPVLVRRASKKYKLTTESSYRFERGVDNSAVAQASARARDLIIQSAGGRESGRFADLDFSPRQKALQVALDVARVNRRLGISLSASRMAEILKSLGISVTGAANNKLIVMIPGFRRDLREEMDLAEEILRIEGFDKVESRLPVTRYSDTHFTDEVPHQRKKSIPDIKKTVAAMGFNEVITYSLISAKAMTDAGFDPADYKHNRIQNPVSAEQEFLSPSLLPGLLQSVVHNIHRKHTNLRFFEIGKRYDGKKEVSVLGLLTYGLFEENWRRKTPISYYDLKGVLENILLFLGVKEWEWREGHPPWAAQAGQASHGGKLLAEAGGVSGDILRRWDIPNELFYAEIFIGEIAGLPEKVLRVKPLSKFPSVRRDVAFVISDSVAVRQIEETMRRTAAPFLSSVRLFDEFKGKNIPTGRRSLAFSLAYQKETGTFTDDEIEALQNRLGEALKKEYQVEFR